MLSLGDSGFSPIFRVVSSDYGKPRPKMIRKPAPNISMSFERPVILRKTMNVQSLISIPGTIRCFKLNFLCFTKSSLSCTRKPPFLSLCFYCRFCFLKVYLNIKPNRKTGPNSSQRPNASVNELRKVRHRPALRGQMMGSGEVPSVKLTSLPLKIGWAPNRKFQCFFPPILTTYQTYPLKLTNIYSP